MKKKTDLKEESGSLGGACLSLRSALAEPSRDERVLAARTPRNRTNRTGN